ncbi:MAG TPA: PAS domain-containing protein [Rhizomicrobium sp.]|nr:PAS domain-containing protein [Rhizomicrobium sp.]
MTMHVSLHPADAYNALAEREGWQSRCHRTLTFQQPQMHALLDVWRGLAAEANGIPRRKDLTPQKLRAHLSDIGIYERLTAPSGEPRYRVRVMGARFGAVLGNFTGRYFDDVIPPHYRKRWHAGPDTVLAAAEPLRFVSRSETAGKGYMTGEYLMCPLLGDDGSVNTALSSAIFEATIPAPAAA